MKKRFLLMASLLALSNEALIAQQNPTPYTTPFANTPAQAVTTANAAWYRGGNFNTGLAGNANIFGTLWNSPIFTRTANANRMRLNGNTTYAVNGYSQARNGYLLLGYGTGYSNYLFANANGGAFSLFHLNGQDGSFVQEGGYRPCLSAAIYEG